MDSAAGMVPSRPLGSSGLLVSMCCLGTMTWGEQNTESESHAQLDFYVNSPFIQNPFIDTAELYPVPPKSETTGATEIIIGNWIAKGGPELRKRIILASKVAGRSSRGYITANRYDPKGKEEDTRLSRQQILDACDASLKRLQTNYLDLYQLHWPDRYTPTFGSLGYVRSNERSDDISYEESVGAIGELIKAGKIRHWGISNENAVGVLKFIEAAKKLGVAPPVSIQNDFSMVDRRFEQDGTAEACSPHSSQIENGVVLLAYGALAGGTLSGKYVDGSDTSAARHVAFPEFQSRYHSEGTLSASRDYAELAKKYGFRPAQLALAWAGSREYMGSVIIGATSIKQLEENIEAFRMPVTPELIAEVDGLNLAHERPYFTGAARLGRQPEKKPVKKEDL